MTLKGLKRQSLSTRRQALKSQVQLSLTFKLQLSIYQVYILLPLYTLFSLYSSCYFLTYSLGYIIVTQGKSRQDIQLADFVLIKLENKGPKLDKLVLYIVILRRQGKQNQYNKVKYICYIRNTNPILYPLSIIAFYFFNY